jgi:RNA polymerase sigma-70 factor (ECF subfamily)
MSSTDAFWDRVGPEIGWVQRQLRRLGVRDPDLDDVTQEVLIAVHRRWSDYDPSRPLRAWLFGFAFRLAKDYRNHSSNRRPNVSLDRDPPDPCPGLEERLEEAARRAMLLAAMEALDLDKRAIVTLIDLEELSMPEAAAILEIPLNTGYSRLRVARAALAAALTRLARKGGA